MITNAGIGNLVPLGHETAVEFGLKPWRRPGTYGPREA
jgi:hypothetical protein